MPSQEKIKYQPLQSNDVEETESETNVKNVEKVSEINRVHWTLKLLFLVFIAMQIIYLSQNGELNFFNQDATEAKSSTQNQNEKNYDKEILMSNKIIDDKDDIWDIKAQPDNILTSTSMFDDNSQNQNEKKYNKENKVIDDKKDRWDISAQTDNVQPDDLLSSISIFDDTTITPLLTLTSFTMSNRRQINQTFFNIQNTSIINSMSTAAESIIIPTKVTTIPAPSNSENHDTKNISSLQQPTDGIIQILQKSHETTNLTTDTSIANYLNNTTIKTISNIKPTTTLIQWHTTATTTIKQATNYYSTPPVQQQSFNTISSDRGGNNSNHTQMTKRQYFINTSKCQMPYIDPFTAEVRKIFKPSHVTGCTKDKAFISVRFDESKGQYILHTNYTVAKGFLKNSDENFIANDLSCCYSQIERSGSGKNADEKFTLLPCTNFHQDFVVPLHIEGVIIDCLSKSKKRSLQKDAFSFIQIRNQNNQKINNNKTKQRSGTILNGPHNLGVLLLGIDSLSRINFRRNMPETFSYLVKNGWYELQGYNKVGDNTFPNLMPLLTGYSGKTALDICRPLNIGGLDACPFVWRKFQDFGFKTAYAEDTTFISTFNYHKKGFQQQPTNHYFRPVALATESKMKKKTIAGLTYCIGRRQAGEYIYDYGLEFATRYRNYSNFGFFWTNSFSHNSFSTAATMDLTMKKYLAELKLRGIMEQSVVIFFSDHGRRWGPLLKLAEGFVEERLPMFFISLPTWLEQKYPEYVKNLKINQKRLITPFDIHMMLQDLLHISAPKYKVTSSSDCPFAQSVFEEISENRTCSNACIPEAWCTCIPYMRVSTKDMKVKRVTQLILEKMNHYFVIKNITSICSELSLREISQAHVHEKDMNENILTYMIEFVTKPQTAEATVFSATVDYNSDLDSIEMDVEDVARHSKYEKTAMCTNDKQAKKYCICRDSLGKVQKYR